MCITNSLCCTAEIKHNIVNQLYFNLKKNRKKKKQGRRTSQKWWRRHIMYEIMSTEKGKEQSRYFVLYG